MATAMLVYRSAIYGFIPTYWVLYTSHNTSSKPAGDASGDNFRRSFSLKPTTYCWWAKSCTSWHRKYHSVLSIRRKGARFCMSKYVEIISKMPTLPFQLPCNPLTSLPTTPCEAHFLLRVGVPEYAPGFCTGETREVKNQIAMIFQFPSKGCNTQKWKKSTIKPNQVEAFSTAKELINKLSNLVATWSVRFPGPPLLPIDPVFCPFRWGKSHTDVWLPWQVRTQNITKSFKVKLPLEVFEELSWRQLYSYLVCGKCKKNGCIWKVTKAR